MITASVRQATNSREILLRRTAFSLVRCRLTQARGTPIYRAWDFQQDVRDQT
ncbi:MAG TPA: hypothetical protein V6D03_08565 [Candidatus Caenarcaniphilales bacterium]